MPSYRPASTVEVQGKAAGNGRKGYLVLAGNPSTIGIDQTEFEDGVQCSTIAASRESLQIKNLREYILVEST